MKEHLNCFLCGSADIKPMPRYSFHGLMKCNNCNFVFCKSIPTLDELIRHYETYPRHDGISAITVKRYRELADSFEKYRKNGNWLDNGCGNGHLLVTAKEKNWKAYGTEFTDIAVEICRNKGIIMNQGALNISDYPKEHFDIITFIEVLEHINNPHEEFEKFNTLLRSGGILYITTPNFNSVSRNFLKEKWNIIEYPEHLSYYTPSTIHKLLVKHGFEKIYLKTTGFSPARIGKSLQQENAQAKPAVNEEKLREMTEQNLLMNIAKNTINKTLDISGKGDTIKALYRKR